MMSRSRHRRKLAAAALVGGVFGISVGTAVAYAYVSYTPGAVGAQHAWADNVRHSYNYAYTSTDHTGCAGASPNKGPGIVNAYGFWLAGCTSGSGSVGGSLASGGALTYGGVFNPNMSTTDHFGGSWARYGSP